MIDKLYEELRQVIDGGSESMTHKDAIESVKIWKDFYYSAPVSDEEIYEIWKQTMDDWTKVDDGTAALKNQPFIFGIRAILKRHGIK